jgi:hypothetical protein
MKKIFILLASMFLLVGCVESLAVLGGGATNGKLVQSSLQSGISYGIQKKTGKTPLGHALNYVKEENQKINKSCSSFTNKKDLKVCLTAEEKIISNQTKIKSKEFVDKSSKKINTSLQFSINEKSKIKYLD